MNTLAIAKGAHRFIIRYETGQECAVLDELTDMVRRRVAGFDWFDASLMSHQLEKLIAWGIDQWAGGDTTISG